MFTLNVNNVVVEVVGEDRLGKLSQKTFEDCCWNVNVTNRGEVDPLTLVELTLNFPEHHCTRRSTKNAFYFKTCKSVHSTRLLTDSKTKNRICKCSVLTVCNDIVNTLSDNRWYLVSAIVFLDAKNRTVTSTVA